MGRGPGSYRVEFAPEMEERLAAMYAYLREDDLSAGEDSPGSAAAVSEAMDTIDYLLAHAPDSIGTSLRRGRHAPAGIQDIRQLDVYPLSVRYEIHQHQQLVRVVELLWLPGITGGEWVDWHRLLSGSLTTLLPESPAGPPPSAGGR
jgi:hypothetical protein